MSSQILFKVCIFGDGGVGKTTLVKRFLTGLFKEDYKMTIGLDFHIKKLNVDGKSITLQIWDFAGEDRFRFLLPTYLRGAAGGIFMYDITRYSSIKNVEEWLEVYEEGIKGQEKEMPIILAGGKLDLEGSRAVERAEAIKLAEAHNFSGFVENSAKTGQNVEETFSMLAKLLLERADITDD